MDKNCEVCGKLMTGEGVMEYTKVCGMGCLDARMISEGKKPFIDPNELDPVMRLFYRRPDIPGSTGKGTWKYNERATRG